MRVSLVWFTLFFWMLDLASFLSSSAGSELTSSANLFQIDYYDAAWESYDLIKNAGLKNHNIFDIDFEKNGTVWIATSDGLYRYDGYTWTRFTQEDGLPSNLIRCVCLNQEGTLWVGTNRGAGTWNGKTFSSHGSERGLAGPSVRRIIEDASGALWFCCDRWPDATVSGGLSCYKNGQWRTMTAAEGFDADYIVDFLQSSQSTNFAIAKQTILQYDNSNWIHPLQKIGLEKQEIFLSIIETQSGEILVFSDLGTYQYHNSQWRFDALPYDQQYKNTPLCLSSQGEILSYRQITNNSFSLVRWTGTEWQSVSSPHPRSWIDHIYNVKRAPDGSIWCVGANTLVRFVREGKEWIRFKKLPHPLFLDCNNQIWFKTDDSLIRYSSLGWSDWDFFRGSILCDANGIPWGFTDQTIYRGMDRDRIAFQLADNGLQQIRGFTADLVKGVWVHGLNANREPTVLYNDGLHSDWLSYSLSSPNPQTILASESDGQTGLWLLAQETPLPKYTLWNIKKEDHSLHASSIPTLSLNWNPSIHVDRQGGIWLLGTIPLQWRPPGANSWQAVTQPIGNLVDYIFENKNSIWFQCNGDLGGMWGFSIKTGDQWSHLSDELFFGKILGNGDIVAGGMTHFYLSPPSNEEPPRRILLPQSGVIEGIVRDEIGRFWVGVNDDVYVSQPDGFPPETIASLVSGTNLQQGDTLRIRCESVEYCLPQNPNKGYCFSWRLDGGIWSPFLDLHDSLLQIGTAPFSIGDHFLEIISRDEMLDVDPTPARLAFAILPIPWQDRVSFWIGLVALIIAVVWLALYALQKKIYLAQYASQLENHVKERTASLLSSEEKYRTLIETTDTGYVIFDNTGRVLDANAEYVRLTGYSRLDEIRGRQLLEWTAPYDIQRNLQKVQECLAQGFVHNLEIDYQHPNGDIVPIDVNASVLPGDEQRIVSLCRDITERRRAEADRKLDELRLETLIHLNQMTNTSLSEIAQYAMEEAVRLTQSQIGYIAFTNDDETILTMHAWSKTAMQQCDVEYKPVMYLVEETGLWGEAVRQRRPIITNDYSAPNPWKKGTPEGHVPIQRHMNVPIVDNGRIVIVAGVGNKSSDYGEADIRQLTLLMTGMWRIVQRKRAEDALQEKTEELDRFFCLVLDLLCIADLEGRFHRLNPQWENLLGYSIAELKTMNFMDLIHPDDVDRTKAAVNELSSQKVIFNFINRYRCKDGSYRWIEWNSAPAGSFIYAAARDITERKQAEEERRKIAEQMQHTQKLESLGVLAGGIAHDFNNLLMAILGHADLASAKLSPLSPIQDNLKAIEKTTLRAAELCKQMLAYSGKGHFIIQSIHLQELIVEMASILQVSISKKVALQYQFGAAVPAVNGDASQIRQIIMNLIVNASEAIGDNQGIITIGTGCMECSRDYLKDTWLDEQLPEGTYVYLEISDSGVGMDRDTLSRIFDPFFTTKFTGRGLGLAAVLGIVRGHKGTIKISSEPGVGTVFRVLFPPSSQPKPDEEKQSSPKENWQGSGTILLVDDEENILIMGKEMLEFLGFKALTAANGREAIEIFSGNSSEIQCVILDLTMPEMDGEETFHALREIDATLKIIVSSGYDEQEVTPRFLGKGLAGFIQKPYHLHEIAQKLQSVLSPQ